MKEKMYRKMIDWLDDFFMGVSNVLRKARGLESHEWSR